MVTEIRAKIDEAITLLREIRDLLKQRAER